MRGGTIPLLVWGTLNLTLLVINWIWEGTSIHVGLFGYCVLVMYLSGIALLIARGRVVLRKGPPAYRAEPEPLPRISFASAGIGIAIAIILLGLTFGRFLVYIGGALLLAALGRLSQELSWQRRTVRRVRGERRP